MATSNLGSLFVCLAKPQRGFLPVDDPASRAMLLPDRRQIGTGALFGTLLGQGHALALGARHFTRCHGVGATAFVVIDAVHSTRKLDGRLLEQCGQPLVGMSPINEC